MTRPARVIINPRAARHNLEWVCRHAPGARVMAVIKADGYGHGIARMARIFDGADAFAVAAIEEAVTIREAGIGKPIVLLEGPFEAAELELVNALGLEVVVYNHEQLDMLVGAPKPRVLWLKFDTGMHRLGFSPEHAADAIARARALDVPLRFMTHFANTHHRGDASVHAQVDAFEALLAGQAGERSLANSGAVLGYTRAHGDWVRPGLMLYGVSPFDHEVGSDLGLQPVMTLRSRLISVRQVRAGEAVGYGGAYVCPEDMPVGVLAYGYGDGYPRHAQTGTPVLVRGIRTQVIGHCSMDMMTVDLRPVPDARFGDAVTLWGEGLPIEEVARASGTIPYELLCRVRMRAQYEEGEP
ncbi:MAG: alanine racemase [Proteobacteria bacterium]|nr:alanine racemase [Pseudomonadota bacterium]